MKICQVFLFNQTRWPNNLKQFLIILRAQGKKDITDNQMEEIQNPQYHEQIESPVVDDQSSNFNQTVAEDACQQNENITNEAQEDSTENVIQKKHRRRHRRNKTNEQVAVENT